MKQYNVTIEDLDLGRDPSDLAPEHRYANAMLKVVADVELEIVDSSFSHAFGYEKCQSVGTKHTVDFMEVAIDYIDEDGGVVKHIADARLTDKELEMVKNLLIEKAVGSV